MAEENKTEQQALNIKLDPINKVQRKVLADQDQNKANIQCLFDRIKYLEGNLYLLRIELGNKDAIINSLQIQLQSIKDNTRCWQCGQPQEPSDYSTSGEGGEPPRRDPETEYSFEMDSEGNRIDNV